MTQVKCLLSNLLRSQHCIVFARSLSLTSAKQLVAGTNSDGDVPTQAEGVLNNGNLQPEDVTNQRPVTKKKTNRKKQVAAEDISRIDLRVGQIRKVQLHPNAESLYVEEMDVGEEKTRQIVTGLVRFVAIEEMRERKVIVMCNLKSSKIRGVMSQGMVVCASCDDCVEIVDPPQDSQPGDRVFASGFDGAPDQQINPKRKLFERILADLKTDASGRACYKTVPLQVAGSDGDCTAQSLKNAIIK